MFSLDAGLVDRDAASGFNREAYQTLEPRVYYAICCCTRIIQIERSSRRHFFSGY